VFLGAACQFPALHRIETECHRGALSKRIGSLSEDAIGYALERQDPRAVFALGCEIARQLKRNGIFRSDWSRGLVVAAVDGIEICSSFARFCDHCMERKVKHTVDGELREELQVLPSHLRRNHRQLRLSHSSGHALSKEWRDRGQLYAVLITGSARPRGVVGSSIYW